MRPLLALLILAATLAVGACSTTGSSTSPGLDIDAARRDQSGHVEPGHQPGDQPGGQPVGLILSS